MARSISSCPAPPQVSGAAGDRITRSLAVRVITPMFGGGVQPGVNDPITLIRVPSIRGQLRFWWRATRGAAQPDVSALRKREAEVWGSVDNPSPVQIEAHVTNLGRAEACARVEQGRSMPRFTQGYPSYALFPFQGNPKQGEQPASARRDVEFRLDLRFPSALEDDVDAALWAWLNFGGLGARTRRGCGALYSADFAPQNRDIAGWWASNQKYLASHQRRPWPTVAQLYYQPNSTRAAMEAWNALVKLLSDFRQGPGLGRSSGQGNLPGRSYWPEADSLRIITGKAETRHRESITVQKPAFPRAELGLPIVFHFKDRDDGPNNSVLYPSGQAQRMASPLILRPLAIGNGSQCVPVVVLLNTPALSGVRVEFMEEGLGASQAFDATAIRDRRLASYQNSPLKNSQQGSALEAFLKYLSGKGYKKA